MKTQVQAAPFHDPKWYPALEGLIDHIPMLKAEAIEALNGMMYLADSRIRQQRWRVLPLLPEPEDAPVFPPAIVQDAQSKAPKTFQLLNGITGIDAFMLSALAPKATIGVHQHENPFVTAMLTLQCKGEAYILNNGERRDFVEGEIIVFDYTMMHEVVNNSDEERIVLLMLLENALLKV